jgi:hypothetical protein
MFQALRQRWQKRETRASVRHPVSLVDPEEFSRLLRSGRKQDLETVARKLSERRRTRV